jgi:ABC-type thiamine transport system ATPase subunit
MELPLNVVHGTAGELESTLLFAVADFHTPVKHPVQVAGLVVQPEAPVVPVVKDL